MFSLILILLIGGGAFFGVSQLQSCANRVAEANVLADVAHENADKAEQLEGAVIVARTAEAAANKRADEVELDSSVHIAAIEREKALAEHRLVETNRQLEEAGKKLEEVGTCNILCRLPDLP